jgi:hypothetical protein
MATRITYDKASVSTIRPLIRPRLCSRTRGFPMSQRARTAAGTGGSDSDSGRISMRLPLTGPRFQTTPSAKNRRPGLGRARNGTMTKVA